MPDTAKATTELIAPMGKRPQVGFDEARAAIHAGTAMAHALWCLISDEHDRDGYALKPSPWEGSGEYQRVHYSDGRDVLVRIPDDRSLPTNEVSRVRVKITDQKATDNTETLLLLLDRINDHIIGDFSASPDTLKEWRDWINAALSKAES